MESKIGAKEKRIALCIGHPGHEIKVLAWLKKTSPFVSILTDGSGPNRPSRLESTRQLLEEMGCTFSTIFGSFSDRQVYELMLKNNSAPFLELAQRLVEEWKQHNVHVVAGDALEGFNTSHDVCRMLINAAVQKCRASGWEMVNYEFPLEKLTMGSIDERTKVIPLDEDLFTWKKEMIVQAYPELASEVQRVVDKYGEGPFRQETISLATDGGAGLEWTEVEPPFYETYGSRQIAAGHYADLITYRQHLKPIAEDLWSWACRVD